MPDLTPLAPTRSQGLVDVLDRILDKAEQTGLNWKHLPPPPPSLAIKRGTPTFSEKTLMAVERAPGGSSLIDVLDKGIVIGAYVRVSLVGIDLVTAEARVVVASIDGSKA